MKQYNLIEAAERLGLTIFEVVDLVKKGQLKLDKGSFQEKELNDYLGSGQVSPEKKQVQAKSFFGDRFPSLVDRFGTKKVEEVTSCVIKSLGEKKTKALLGAKESGQLLVISQDLLEDYLNRLNQTLELISQEYELVSDDKDYFSLEKAPFNFLPTSLSYLEKGLKGRQLVEGLNKEGHSVYYLQAILVEGLGLGKKPISSLEAVSQKDLTQKVAEYFELLDKEYNAGQLDNQMRELGSLLIESNDCHISFNPKWKTLAKGNLKKYLAQIFGENNQIRI